MSRRKLRAGNPRELLAIAAEFAACAELYGDAPTADEQERRLACIREALATLQSAVGAGYKERASIEMDPRFKILRGEQEFRDLVNQLK